MKYLVLINMPVGPPKTVVHSTEYKKLNPIFYLPEKSSQILSPVSGMLVFLCLISPCFCQTMLISSSVIRSLFAWIMDNLLMYQENRIICTRKNATDKSLTTEATRASPSHKTFATFASWLLGWKVKTDKVQSVFSS